jgi:shikimate kinase
MKNIVMIGFMGTGKTVVAKALARLFDMKYVSTDELIESGEKKPIKDIFRDEGEPYFRKIEKEVVKKVCERSGQVIDAGGGVVLDEENMAFLGKNGIVVCLWADVDAIYERTSRHGHRPLLNVDDPKKKISELLEYRAPFYEIADIHINTTDMDVEGVAGLIKNLIEDDEKSEQEKQKDD